MFATPAPLDPRWYQIATLAGLLAWGVFGLAFDVRPAHAAVIIITAQLVQWLGSRAVGVPFDPKSSLISSLSLCLLLRTNSVLVAAAVAAFAIGSKFVLRIRGKHVLNPTNGALVLAIVVAPLLGESAWVSPGQWGNVALFAFFLACVGTLVVTRSSRADVTIAFLLTWCALVFGRSLWLGEPMAIPLHRLQSGALLLFAFFMISDPKTTPDARGARILFGAVVAFGAWYVQFRLFRNNGLLWSLALCSLFVPVLDRVWPGRRFSWSTSSPPPPPPASSSPPPALPQPA